ncbi:hypothetical protein LXA43DRAFT_601347 [Ganoderma leucocontextum]|nr:hypothetical protein LXA43DRAFT_601347 [Ganoderma leucocontextum]
MIATVIHDVSIDIPPRRQSFSDEEHAFEIYLILTLETCHDHRTQPTYRAAYTSAKQQFQQFSERKLQRGLSLRDAPLIFEHCMRTIARTVERDMNDPIPANILGALGEVAAIPIADGTRPRHTYNNTVSLRQRSLATVIWIFFRQYFLSTSSQSVHAVQSYMFVRHLARFVNACAEADFMPPIVVRVASWFATFRVRFGVDARTQMSDLFRNLEHFWPAYDAYVERQLKNERERCAKVAKAPNRYRCAMNGCGIQAFKRRALRKCGGDCPPETKPYYCSNQCQVEHWRVHRYTCKSEGLDAEILEDDDDPDWEDVEPCEAVIHESRFLEESWNPKRGREIFVDIPNPSRSRKGEVWRVRSRTLHPLFLKGYRFFWAMSRRSPAFRKYDPDEE